MKQTNTVRCLLLLCGALLMATTPLSATHSFVVVNADKCLDVSKVGKQENEFLKELQGKFEKGLLEKEKAVKDISVKINDDYLESLSEEAEKELRQEFEKANLSFAEARQQAFQMFQQAKQQIMDKLFRWVSKASETVAKNIGVKVVFQSENVLYVDESLDITKQVIEELDDMYVKELEAKTTEK